MLFDYFDIAMNKHLLPYNRMHFTIGFGKQTDLTQSSRDDTILYLIFRAKQAKNKDERERNTEKKTQTSTIINYELVLQLEFRVKKCWNLVEAIEIDFDGMYFLFVCLLQIY